MKGRPPKPAALKELQGHAGHRKDDGRAELSLPAGVPEPPEFLSEGARKEFFRIAGELAKVPGLLSTVDASALGIYCSYFDQWQQAERDIPRYRAEWEKAPGADKGMHYAMLMNATGERNKARKELRAYLSELGLSPAARARIRVPTGQMILPGMGPDVESPFDRSRRLAGA